MWSHFHLFWPYGLAKSVAQWNPVIIFTCASPHRYVYLEKVSFSIWLDLSLIHKWHLRSLKTELLKKKFTAWRFWETFQRHFCVCLWAGKTFFSSKDPNHKCEWKTFIDNKATSCARGCGLGKATSRISSSSWDWRILQNWKKERHLCRDEYCC